MLFVRRTRYSLAGADVWLAADIWRIRHAVNCRPENPTFLSQPWFIKIVEENSTGQNIKNWQGICWEGDF